MTVNKKVVLDAGHGGSDPGASYYGRQEKRDTLNLTFAVGNILEKEGVAVNYTRVDDVYDTPFEKAAIANQAGADYFVSIHRNAMPTPNTASGIESLVYENSGVPALLAANINAALQEVGFTNLGVIERPGLVVLRRTEMPAVLVEAGFIDNEADNQFFDRNFQAIAEAIAHGIIATMRQEEEAVPEYYQIQTGAYQNQGLANQQLAQLKSQGFPAFMVHENGYHKIRVGAFLNLDYAVQMEKNLRDYGYNTFIVKA
ncbi:MAG: N-acetylmuramoyl-L-alanine amidase [Hungatella sp.]